MNRTKNHKVAFFSPHLEHIGETRSIPELAKCFAQKGWQVDLLEAWQEWHYLKDKKYNIKNVEIISLKGKVFRPILPRLAWLPKWLAFRIRVFLGGVSILPSLIHYLHYDCPDTLIVRMLPSVALLAKLVSNSETKMIISMGGWPRTSLLRKFLWRLLFSKADAITVPSENLIEIVRQIANVPEKKIFIIPDPVIYASIFKKAKEPVKFNWFKPGEPPVILGVGRLTRQKDFETLIKAFALVRKELPARLVILGEGEDRPKLERLAKDLGVSEDVYMPGFVDNPYKYMALASVFVLSSRWEGLVHSLVEALALGVPAIATDCPHGPKEILLNGKAGILVPVGDAEAMANAIVELLRNPKKSKQLVEEGVKSAIRFSVDASAQAYISLLERLL
jgi:glycosyltransferase involved in cell wall biosynthesis